jgi:hypothetical protein
MQKKFRQEGVTLSDKEIEKIRGEIYELANIALESYFESKKTSSKNGVNKP